MKSAPKEWKRKPVLIGLSIHCAIWWIWLSVTSMFGSNWGTRWQWWLYIIWSNVIDQVAAPFVFGNFMTRAEFYWWAAVRLLITSALIAMTYHAVRTQRRKIVMLAHCTVVLYWIASMIIVFSEIIAEAESFGP